MANNADTIGSIKWGGVKLRKFEVILGDNPGGSSSGPPVQLDWDHEESEQFSTVDGFAQKYPQKSTVGKNLYRLTEQRRRELLASKHSEEEMRHREQEIQTIRLNRKTSANDREPGSIKELIQSQKVARETNKPPKKKLFRMMSRRR
jgi:hypothetical protein